MDITYILLYPRRAIFSVVLLLRPQHFGYRSAALPFIDVNGQIAVVTVIGIEKTQLLMAIASIIGVIYIQNEHFRRLLIRFDKNIQKDLGYKEIAFFMNYSGNTTFKSIRPAKDFIRPDINLIERL